MKTNPNPIKAYNCVNNPVKKKIHPKTNKL